MNIRKFVDLKQLSFNFNFEMISLTIVFATTLLFGNLVTASENVILEENAYVCHGARLHGESTVGKNTIVFPGVVIPEKRVLPPNAYIVNYPSTDDLLEFISLVKHKDTKYLQYFKAKFEKNDLFFFFRKFNELRNILDNNK